MCWFVVRLCKFSSIVCTNPVKNKSVISSLLQTRSVRLKSKFGHSSLFRNFDFDQTSSNSNSSSAKIVYLLFDGTIEPTNENLVAGCIRIHFRQSVRSRDVEFFFWIICSLINKLCTIARLFFFDNQIEHDKFLL